MGSAPQWLKEPAMMVMAKAVRSRELIEAVEQEVKEEDGEKAEETEVKSENPCDYETACDKDKTCCFNKEAKKWVCCPLPKVRKHATTNSTTATKLTSDTSISIWTTLA